MTFHWRVLHPDGSISYWTEFPSYLGPVREGVHISREALAILRGLA